jgi:O-antigen/teichoic acid export membrane protein
MWFKLQNSYLTKLIKDILGLATSPRRLVNTLHMPLYANSLFLLINNVAMAAVGFVFWILAARFYTAEAVGLGSAAISAMTLLSAISLIGLNFGVVRFLAGSGKKAPELINTCFTIGGVVSAVAAVVFLLGVGVWSPALHFISNNGVYFISFVIFTVACITLSLSNYTFIAERHTGYVAMQGISVSLLKVILIVALARFWSSFSISSSWGLSALFVAAVSILILQPRIRPGYRFIPVIKKEMVKTVFRYSFINYVSDLLWQAPSYILPIMVVNLQSAEQNAYFYIAWTFGMILRAIPTSTSLSLFAEGSYNQEQLVANVNRSIKITLVLLLPAIAIILLLGDKLLLLFGPEYSKNGTKLLWLMAIAGFPVSVNFIYISIKRVEKKLKGVLLLTAFTAVVTLVLSYVLLPKSGLPGVGIAWLVAQGTAAVVICASWIRKRRIVPDIRSTPMDK